MFVSYKIVPMRDLDEVAEQCDERHADFWGLYGIDEKEDAYAVGDFRCKGDAEFIRDAIQASQ